MADIVYICSAKQETGVKKRVFISAVAVPLACAFATAQTPAEDVPDTAGIYGERADSLEAAVFVSSQNGNYLSKGKPIRTEVISSAGLRKMACCTLTESFENSASVTVGYSDAVTGARQIRLLGLSGVYTQMLDETRPVMRGLSAPFGLSYIPGQWLESIQIAKGAASVTGGVESITGQINLEHRKPTDEKPLFLNVAVMSDTKIDFNAVSSLQMGRKWSTVILGHVSGNIRNSDHNGDGYMDDPKMLQFNFANRWLYYADNGVQVRFGVRAIQDRRSGGQEGYDRDAFMRMMQTQDWSNPQPWGSEIYNRSINGYLKVGIPLKPDNSSNIAVVADYTYYDMDSWFGATRYLAGQHSSYLNFLYQDEINEHHRLTFGLGGMYDRYSEDFLRVLAGFPAPVVQGTGVPAVTGLANAGVFGEYTFTYGDRLTAVAGIRTDWYSMVDDGKSHLKFSPRVTVKYSPSDNIVIRLNGGRGLRYATPLIDNIGVFSTGKEFKGDYDSHTLEDAWIFGGNFTFYLPFGASSDTYLSLDYFRTSFSQQMVVDYEYYEHNPDDPTATQIWFYNLDGRRSFTDTYQIDFNVEPVERFTVTATFRYTNARIELAGNEFPVERPMTSRFKGVLNLQYATSLNKWIFDVTASVNGPSRVYAFMRDRTDADGDLLYRNGYTPVYPLLYAQVTRRFKGVDIYVGGENLTNFRQKDVVIGAVKDNGVVSGRQRTFDASAVWGPLMGVKIYAGVRFNLWKKS